MTNKGFEAKGYTIKPHFNVDCTIHSITKEPAVFIKKGKQYRGAVHPKQKSFSKLPF